MFGENLKLMVLKVLLKTQENILKQNYTFNKKFWYYFTLKRIIYYCRYLPIFLN